MFVIPEVFSEINKRHTTGYISYKSEYLIMIAALMIPKYVNPNVQTKSSVTHISDNNTASEFV